MRGSRSPSATWHYPVRHRTWGADTDEYQGQEDDGYLRLPVNDAKALVLRDLKLGPDELAEALQEMGLDADEAAAAATHSPWDELRHLGQRSSYGRSEESLQGTNSNASRQAASGRAGPAHTDVSPWPGPRPPFRLCWQGLRAFPPPSCLQGGSDSASLADSIPSISAPADDDQLSLPEAAEPAQGPSRSPSIPAVNPAEGAGGDSSPRRDRPPGPAPTAAAKGGKEPSPTGAGGSSAPPPGEPLTPRMTRADPEGDFSFTPPVATPPTEDFLDAEVLYRQSCFSRGHSEKSGGSWNHNELTTRLQEVQELRQAQGGSASSPGSHRPAVSGRLAVDPSLVALWGGGKGPAVERSSPLSARSGQGPATGSGSIPSPEPRETSLLLLLVTAGGASCILAVGFWV